MPAQLTFAITYENTQWTITVVNAHGVQSEFGISHAIPLSDLDGFSELLKREGYRETTIEAITWPDQGNEGSPTSDDLIRYLSDAQLPLDDEFWLLYHMAYDEVMGIEWK